MKLAAQEVVELLNFEEWVFIRSLITRILEEKNLPRHQSNQSNKHIISIEQRQQVAINIPIEILTFPKEKSIEAKVIAGNFIFIKSDILQFSVAAINKCYLYKNDWIAINFKQK